MTLAQIKPTFILLILVQTNLLLFHCLPKKQNSVLNNLENIDMPGNKSNQTVSRLTGQILLISLKKKNICLTDLARKVTGCFYKIVTKMYFSMIFIILAYCSFEIKKKLLVTKCINKIYFRILFLFRISADVNVKRFKAFFFKSYLAIVQAT